MHVLCNINHIKQFLSLVWILVNWDNDALGLSVTCTRVYGVQMFSSHLCLFASYYSGYSFQKHMHLYSPVKKRMIKSCSPYVMHQSGIEKGYVFHISWNCCWLLCHKQTFHYEIWLCTLTIRCLDLNQWWALTKLHLLGIWNKCLKAFI